MATSFSGGGSRREPPTHGTQGRNSEIATILKVCSGVVASHTFPFASIVMTINGGNWFNYIMFVV